MDAKVISRAASVRRAISPVLTSVPSAILLIPPPTFFTSPSELTTRREIPAPARATSAMRLRIIVTLFGAAEGSCGRGCWNGS